MAGPVCAVLPSYKILQHVYWRAMLNPGTCVRYQISEVLKKIELYKECAMFASMEQCSEVHQEFVNFYVSPPSRDSKTNTMKQYNEPRTEEKRWQGRLDVGRPQVDLNGEASLVMLHCPVSRLILSFTS
jgi:hypothetical protein